MLPLVKRGQRLFIGIADPTNLAAIDDLRFQTSLRIDPVVVEQDKLEERINRAIEAVDTSMADLGGDDDFDLENLDVEGGEDQQQEDDARDDIEDAPVVRFVNKILLDAIKRGASDIHFEPYESFSAFARDSTAFCPRLPSRRSCWRTRFVLASRSCRGWTSPSAASRRTGRIKMRLSKNRAIDFRVNTCPTLFGEKIVLRILDPSSAQLGIDKPWVTRTTQKRAVSRSTSIKPYGMILVTGPTGSGKTVSLYTGPEHPQYRGTSQYFDR